MDILTDDMFGAMFSDLKTTYILNRHELFKHAYHIELLQQLSKLNAKQLDDLIDAYNKRVYDTCIQHDVFMSYDDYRKHVLYLHESWDNDDKLCGQPLVTNCCCRV